MDLPWGDKRSTKFITNVGLITSNGPFGQNIMSCEWMHHISYAPGMIAVCIRPADATHENIKKNKEFGISFCANDQATLANVAGNYSAKNYDKISALKELGFEFYKGKNIKAFLVKDAALNIECKLIKTIELGDHMMFVGEIVEAVDNPEKEPLGYHKGKYWILDKAIEKPSDKERDRIKNTVIKFKKNM